MAPRRSVADRWLLFQIAVASRIDRADTSKFLEQFRYTIVASQLLSGHSFLGGGQHGQSLGGSAAPAITPESTTTTATGERRGAVLSSNGAAASVLGALLVAYAVSWLIGGGYAHLTRRRLAGAVAVGAAVALVGQVYLRRQWLRYRREQALTEVTDFVAVSQDFDGASSAAIALIQEVELVSRGYRM